VAVIVTPDSLEVNPGGTAAPVVTFAVLNHTAGRRMLRVVGAGVDAKTAVAGPGRQVTLMLRLKPGRYELSVQPPGAAGASKALRTDFVVQSPP
jgi:hypothetical protein